LVDRVVGRGSGNANAAYCPGCTVAEQQAAIDALLPFFAGMTQLTGTYTLTGSGNQVLSQGSASIEVTGTVPEPSTMWSLTGGMLAACVLLRRRHLR
jgi:PEP-CTERM motif